MVISNYISFLVYNETRSCSCFIPPLSWLRITRDSPSIKKILKKIFKTALFGSDPNWGRIIAAIGSSEIDFLNQNKIDISIGSHLIVKNGIEFKKSKIASKLMKNKNIELNINLNSGNHSSYMLTNDIGINYVKFNSSYTT